MDPRKLGFLQSLIWKKEKPKHGCQPAREESSNTLGNLSDHLAQETGANDCSGMEQTTPFLGLLSYVYLLPSV